MSTRFRRGDPVVFVVSKTSQSPGPRAKDIHPAAHGDVYSYSVEKYWTVVEVQPDGAVILVTRRGKRHTVPADDLRLRPARWWERWLYRNRFPAPDTPAEQPQTENAVTQ